MKADHEVELKFELDPGGVGLLRDHPLLGDREGGGIRQRSVYFDTGDGALRKAGFSLRVRESEGRFVQTVKEARGASAGLFDRAEWEWPIAGPAPEIADIRPARLASLLTPAFAQRLAPVVITTIDRTTWHVPYAGSQIALVIDRGAIEADGRTCPIHEVEMELGEGTSADLFAFARALGETVSLRLGVRSKAERGFALADDRLDSMTKAEPVALCDEMNVAEGLAAIVHVCLRHFRLNEPLIAVDGDPVALHQARVAMRRLRSAFSLFAPALKDAEHDRLKDELRWFTGQLGDARNLDVFAKRLGEDPAFAPWRGRLERMREDSYALVRTALASYRLRALMLDLVAWAECGPWREAETAYDPLARFAARRLDRRWRAIRKAGDRLEHLKAERLHRLRIDVKKLRYAVEFLAALHRAHDSERKHFAAAIEDIQESLGALNDIATARAILAALAGDAPADTVPAIDPVERHQHLADAAKAYRAAVETGPFWR